MGTPHTIHSLFRSPSSPQTVKRCAHIDRRKSGTHNHTRHIAHGTIHSLVLPFSQPPPYHSHPRCHTLPTSTAARRSAVLRCCTCRGPPLSACSCTIFAKRTATLFSGTTVPKQTACCYSRRGLRKVDIDHRRVEIHLRDQVKGQSHTWQSPVPGEVYGWPAGWAR